MTEPLYATPLDASERALRDAIADFHDAVRAETDSEKAYQLWTRLRWIESSLAATVTAASIRTDELVREK